MSETEQRRKEFEKEEFDRLVREAKSGMDYKPKSMIKIRHYILIAFICLFASFYLIWDQFRNWVIMQYIFIIADWQLSLAIIMLILLTIGWYLFELIAIFFYMIDNTVSKRASHNIITRTRFTLISIFLSLFLSFYIFNVDFSNPFIYFTSFLFFICFLMLYRTVFKIRKGLNKNKDPFKKKKKDRFPKPAKEEFDIRTKHKLLVVGVMFGIIFLSVFLIFDAITNQWGIIAFIQLILSTTVNPIMAWLFFLIIIVTILWKPLVYLILIINKFTKFLLTTVARKKINRSRILFGVFAIALLLSKNLMFFIEDKVQLQIISFCFSVGISVLSFFILKRVYR